jgi:hypothetical protein
VEAERTVTVETAGDANAFLGLQIRGDLAGSGDQISLDFASAGNGDAQGINENAKTVLDKVLLVQNNGTENSIGISFDIDVDGIGDGTDGEVFGFTENTTGNFDPSGQDISLDGEPLDSGQATAYDLEIELRESELSGGAETWVGTNGENVPASFDVTVTITAN